MSMSGINVIGRFQASVGTTVAGLATVAALQRAGVPVAMLCITDGINQRPPEVLPNVTLVSSPRELPYKITLFLDSILMLETMLDIYRDELADHHISTVLYWELDYLPRRWEKIFARFDSILSPTTFVQRALSLSYGRESSLIPVTPLHNVAYVGKRDAGKPFTFFMNFDVLSTLERKNPVAVLQTFARAFGMRTDVHLVVKVWESPPWEFDRAALARLQQQLPNATFLLNHLTYTEMLELIRECDVYVSLHRTEGLGLGILEAMSFGKPVIATDYGGSRDFVDAFCALPVPYTLVPVDTTQSCYHISELGAQAYWADANQAVAAEHMRRIQAEPALYHALSAGAFARYHERRAQFLSLKWLQPLFQADRELQAV